MRKTLLFGLIAGFISVAITALAAMTLSEFAYYFKEGKWFFLERHADGAGEPGDMGLYREAFAIKKGQRVRILAIGGSTTYGFGVEPHMTWPKLLADKLEKNFPGKFEVINLGRLGAHLGEYISNYRNSSNKYVPRDKWILGGRPLSSDLAAWGWKDLAADIIIVAPIVNDTAPDFLFLAKPNKVGALAQQLMDLSDKAESIRKFAIGYYLNKGLTAIVSRNTEPFERESEKLKLIEDQYKKNLEQFLLLWDRKQTRVYLIGLPLLFNKADGEESARIAAQYWDSPDPNAIAQQERYLPVLELLEKKVRNAVSRERNILVKEVGECIKKMPFPERLRYYHDSIHMVGAGNAVVADEAYTFMGSE